MALEEMVIAHGYLTVLGEEKINHLLDLLEDPRRVTPVGMPVALRRFLKDLEEEFGEDHPSAQQVRKALALQPKGSAVGVLKSAGGRICLGPSRLACLQPKVTRWPTKGRRSG